MSYRFHDSSCSIEGVVRLVPQLVTIICIDGGLDPCLQILQKYLHRRDPMQPSVDVVSTDLNNCKTDATAQHQRFSPRGIDIDHQRCNGRLKITLKHFWIGFRETPSGWHDATSAVVNSMWGLLDANPVRVDATLVSGDATSALSIQSRLFQCHLGQRTRCSQWSVL